MKAELDRLAAAVLALHHEGAASWNALKKSGDPSKEYSAFQDAHQRDSNVVVEFLGTENPRHLRVIDALLKNPQTRKAIDMWGGCSNGPELVAELRRRGLDIPCDKVPCIDRDGFEVKRGVYHLTAADRRKIGRWLVRRGKTVERGSNA
ncbi:hypothetical protein [Variovorax paradoxus]|uniref:hypothetical protein n=1 Tax=Variovorax paradoxus TaxID=34073 RepID=UPI00277F1717|nr:hypothetical protein [Variovorax paradoxus]MDP9932528.1 hypothetical protein [Variovorax paradoxus]